MGFAISRLENLTLVDVGEYGVKAANLGHLASKYRVPPGLVIGKSVLAHQLGGIGRDLERSRQSDHSRDELRRRVFGELPERLNQEIFESLRGVPAGAQGYAVRSSSTYEDLPGMSFAGQYFSALAVSRTGLIHAIQECWASQFEARPHAYATTRGISLDEASMAVLVQQMISPTFSGVCFSNGPTQRSRERIVIESVPGAGDLLVSGQATPWHFELDRNGQIIQRRGPSARMDRPGDDSLAAIAQIAVEIEELFGKPQDIEWAIDGVRIYILQSRPITTSSANVELPGVTR
ncbi:PEP/pyruvate-binding domain-containing protein [Catellatospora citrea]|uniref:PEP/pyruvate-binding domain-containing protein n=1 Tax=Catellatospora citrea TaxID=53366 RepID=UPI0033C9E8F8